MYFHDKKLVRLVFDHLEGKPGKIHSIMMHRRCSSARAYQIVNELIHYALGYVPRETDQNYHQMRDPNVIAFHLHAKYHRYRDFDTPEGFYNGEINFSYSGHEFLTTSGRSR